MRAVGPVRLGLRVAGTTPVATGLLVVLIAVLAFLGAAAPVLLATAQSASLRFALQRENPVLIDPTLTVPGVVEVRPGRGDTASTFDRGVANAWGGALGQLDELESRFGPELRAVLGAPSVATTVAAGSAGEPVGVTGDTDRPITELLLTADPRFADRVRWLEGGEPEPDPTPDAPIQVALSAPASEAMAWPVGEVRSMSWTEGEPTEVEVTGVYAPLDPTAGDWSHLPTSLRHATIVVGLGDPIYQAVAFTAAADVERLAPLTQISRTSGWFPVELDRIEVGRAEEIVTELRTASAVPAQLDTVVQGFLPGDTLTSGLPVRIAEALPLGASLAAIGALLAGGPLVVAVLALALGARTVVARRSATAALADARGASRWALVGVLGGEGLAIGVLGAAIGLAAAAILLGPPPAAALVVPVVVAVAPAAVLGLAGHGFGRARGTSSRVMRRWRVGAELAIVVVALAAAVALLVRGRGVSGVDPLLAVMPVLLCAVGGVVALRLQPLVLAVAARVAVRTRGIVAMLGPAMVRGGDGLRVAPVLATVVGVSIAVFSVGFIATVDDGIRTAARAAVGADLRLSGAYITERELDAVRALDGVRADAPVYADQEADAELPNGDAEIVVYVVDAAELRAVQRDPETAIPMPASITETDGDRVPVVMSAALAERAGGGIVSLRGEELDPVAVAPSVSPLGSVRNWIAVDRANADRILSQTFSPAVVLLALEPGADAGVVADAAQDAVGAELTATTPALAAAVRSDDPALGGARAALLAAFAITAALLLLAVVIALLLGAPARARLLGILGTQGLPRRREVPIVLWELAPALLVATPIGLLIGLGMPSLVVAAIDLTGFVGGAEQPAIRLGGALPLLVALGVAAAAVLAMLLAALAASRGRVGRTRRPPDSRG